MFSIFITIVHQPRIEQDLLRASRHRRQLFEGFCTVERSRAGKKVIVPAEMCSRGRAIRSSVVSIAHLKFNIQSITILSEF